MAELGSDSAGILQRFAAVGGARYSIGWSSGRLSWLLSACAVFVYLLGQFARQQRKSIGQHDGPCDN